MSAAVWDLTPAPARMPAAHPGRHLTLVPGGSAVAVEPVAARVRLTRWGRLAVTLAVLVAVITIATSMVAGGSTAAVSGAASVSTVTVQADQTLSEIAARELPGLPVREGVAQIQIANNLSSSAIHAGQTLQIPSN